MRFEGKKALITGGCSGMGRITALKLASEGADVAIFDLVLNEEVAEEIRAMGREAYLMAIIWVRPQGSKRDGMSTASAPA